MADDGTVSIHGKQYRTVALRIKEFRSSHPDYSIDSEVLSAADLVQVKTTISDETGRVIATGLAEEERGSTNINKTSALENAETSAVGRALAFFGLGGTEIASADEVANAIQQQGQMAIDERLIAHMSAVRDLLPTILCIKEGIASGSLGAAREAWNELTDDEKKALWVAPSKGGIFTTAERSTMQTTEFKEAA